MQVANKRWISICDYGWHDTYYCHLLFTKVDFHSMSSDIHLEIFETGSHSSISPPIKIQMATLILKSFQCSGGKKKIWLKQFLIRASHLSKTRLLCGELKPTHLRVLMECQRKEAPFWRYQVPSCALLFVQRPSVTGKHREKIARTQHKREFVTPSNERQSPYGT